MLIGYQFKAHFYPIGNQEIPSWIWWKNCHSQFEIVSKMAAHNLNLFQINKIFLDTEKPLIKTLNKSFKFWGYEPPFKKIVFECIGYLTAVKLGDNIEKNPTTKIQLSLFGNQWTKHGLCYFVTLLLLIRCLHVVAK